MHCFAYVFFSHGQKKPSHSPLNSDQGLKMCDVKWRCMINSQTMKITGLTGTAETAAKMATMSGCYSSTIAQLSTL